MTDQPSQHHLTPEAIAATIDDLRAMALGEAAVRIADVDWVVKCWTLALQMESLQQDAARYQWLRGEHDPADLPIAQVVWKRGSDPRGDWVNLIDGEDLDRHIDAATVAQSSQAQGLNGSPLRQGARPDGQDGISAVKDLSASASPATKEQQ